MLGEISHYSAMSSQVHQLERVNHIQQLVQFLARALESKVSRAGGLFGVGTEVSKPSAVVPEPLALLLLLLLLFLIALKLAPQFVRFAFGDLRIELLALGMGCELRELPQHRVWRHGFAPRGVNVFPRSVHVAVTRQRAWRDADRLGKFRQLALAILFLDAMGQLT